ncbi:MAG TPA: DUF6665 family protein [Xanthobacteraceae bacterium]|jgi:hypothetical protein|nr:DUF6665 family protein [Xanthobacteraceae bacterium]
MSLRPPRGLPKPHETPATALEVEIAREMASALGRLGHKLECALAALRDHDAARAGKPGQEAAAARRQLVAEAATALWQFIVQREACGLRDSRRIFEDYRVPSEVRNGMGISPGAGGREPAPHRPIHAK